MFSRVSEPRISQNIWGSIHWDKEPKYGMVLTALKILFDGQDSYALVLEAANNEVYARVGLLLYKDRLSTSPASDLFEDGDVATLKIE